MNNYLSIDCANKSLAIGLYSCDSNIKQKISIDNISDINNLIKIHFVKVYDLTPGKKLTETTVFEKTIGLKNVLKEVNTLIAKYIETSEYELLIEFQMNVNDKSKCVFNQIVYEYVDKCNIHTMPPAKKNLIYLHKELKYCNIMNISNSNYKCNKDHSKYNFIYFLTAFDYLYLLIGVNKKNYDDMADTFTQFIAHIIL